MSPEIDRRIGSSGQLVVVIAVLLAFGAGGYIWYRSSIVPAPPGPAMRIPVRFDEPLAVTLEVPADGSLFAQNTTVKRQPDTQSQAREVLGALLSDPHAAQSPVLAGLRLRALYIDSNGTAFVDLASPPSGGVKASAAEELSGLYAFINTLSRNFEEIKRIRFLLEGREAQTLAGHIDLTRTFTRRTDLVKP